MPVKRTLRARTLVTTMIAAVSLAVLTACSEDSPSKEAAKADFGHIHGIGVNPADDVVYVASHNGVFRIADGDASLIADRAQDTMGFTIAGPDDFVASGHPAPGTSDPNPLGLISSSDRAKTWKPMSLGGQADFHSIDAVEGRVYAYSGDQLVMTKDRTTWSSVLQAPLIDFAVDPQSPDDLVATTTSGQVIAFAVGEDPKVLADAPPLAFIDRTADSDLVGVDPDGKVFASDDNGVTWSERSSLDGAPQAVSVRADTWYAATEASIVQSSDEGKTWRMLVNRSS